MDPFITIEPEDNILCQWTPTLAKKWKEKFEKYASFHIGILIGTPQPLYDLCLNYVVENHASFNNLNSLLPLPILEELDKRLKTKYESEMILYGSGFENK